MKLIGFLGSPAKESLSIGVFIVDEREVTPRGKGQSKHRDKPTGKVTEEKPQWGELDIAIVTMHLLI